MNEGQNLIVTLRVYKGKLTRDYDTHEVNSENQTVKIAYGILEWNIFLENARSTFTRMNVESVKEEVISYTDTDRKDKRGDVIRRRHTKYVNIDIPENIKQEVDKVMKDEIIELTPDQRRIADLEAKLDMLTTQDRGKTHKSKLEPKKEKSKVEAPSGEDINTIRAEYKELNPTGKGAFAGWGIEVLKEKIESFKQA